MKRNGISFPEIGLGGHPELPREGTIALLRAALRAWEQRTHQREETEFLIRANSRGKKKKRPAAEPEEDPQDEHYDPDRHPET